MTITLYGIANCDTVKKARRWLDEAGQPYIFHDYKKLGADADLLSAWVAAAGWERVLNRAGTSFRALSDADKVDIDPAKAIRLMLANPSMIKRPILTGVGDAPLIGFAADQWAAALGR